MSLFQKSFQVIPSCIYYIQAEKKGKKKASFSFIKERGKKSFKEVDSDLFPSFSAAANKKVKREEEKCFLLFSYTKAFFFLFRESTGN